MSDIFNVRPPYNQMSGKMYNTSNHVDILIQLSLLTRHNCGQTQTCPPTIAATFCNCFLMVNGHLLLSELVQIVPEHQLVLIRWTTQSTNAIELAD